AVFGAQPVHRGTKAAGARAIKVGDLHNTHTVRTSGAHVQSTMWNRHVPEQSMNSADRPRTSYSPLGGLVEPEMARHVEVHRADVAGDRGVVAEPEPSFAVGRAQELRFFEVHL